MSDWYRNFANSSVGTTITKQFGLPRPAVLRRYEPGQPLLPGPAIIGSAGEGRLRDALTTLLHGEGVHVQSPVTADGATDGEKPAAVILDATGLHTPADLASAHDFVTWARAKYPWMEKGREHAAAELIDLLASAQTVRQKLIEGDPSLADFFPWFDEQFPAATVGRR